MRFDEYLHSQQTSQYLLKLCRVTELHLTMLEKSSQLPGVNPSHDYKVTQQNVFPMKEMLNSCCVRFICVYSWPRWSTAVATWRCVSTAWTCLHLMAAIKTWGWWPWAIRCPPAPSLTSSCTATCSCSEPVWIWSSSSSTPGKFGSLGPSWRARISPLS